MYTSNYTHTLTVTDTKSHQRHDTKKEQTEIHHKQTPNRRTLRIPEWKIWRPRQPSAQGRYRT